MVRKVFTQGDIVLMNFTPQAGHEQAGKRPALVISNRLLNQNTNQTMVVPITSTMTDNPFHVKLSEDTKTQGMVICEHARAADLTARDAHLLEKAPEGILEQVLNIVYGYLEIL